MKGHQKLNERKKEREIVAIANQVINERGIPAESTKNCEFPKIPTVPGPEAASTTLANETIPDMRPNPSPPTEGRERRRKERRWRRSRKRRTRKKRYICMTIGVSQKEGRE